MSETQPKIVVVDDEPSIVRMLQKVLDRSLGAEVQGFSSGELGLDYFREHSAETSLIITDLRMPGMDGMELCRQVRHLRPDVPLLMLTAYASDEMRAAADMLGVNAFIQKPFLPLEFIEVVKRVLSGGRA